MTTDQIYQEAAQMMAFLDPDNENDWEEHVAEYQETVEIAGHQCLLSYAPAGRWDVWLQGRGEIGSSSLSAQEAVTAAERRMNVEAYLAYLEEWGGRYALVEIDDAGAVAWVNSVEPTTSKAFQWRRMLYPSAEVMEIKGRLLLPRSLTEEAMGLCRRITRAGLNTSDRQRIARLEKLHKIAADRWRRRAGYRVYR